jgi:hypothetical protein
MTIFTVGGGCRKYSFRVRDDNFLDNSGAHISAMAIQKLLKTLPYSKLVLYFHFLPSETVYVW